MDNQFKDIREPSGLILLEILDFEDKGNTWEIPFETLGHFQFALSSTRADVRDRARYGIIAERLNKPLAIACEPRVLKVESDEIVAAAKKNGVPVEYIVFPDEGHGFVKKENEIKGYTAVIAFLDKYLKGPTAATP